LTRPTTRTGRGKVAGVRGIIVNWLHYWHPIMQSPGIAGSVVPVRYEPFDMGVVFAFIGGQWLDCFADQYAQVHGRSEREWLLILEEWRAQQRQQGKKRVVFKETLLAPLLESVAAEEQILAQQQRDLEGQALRAPLLGTRVVLPVGPALPAAAEDEELDLAAIPRYEEYRS